MIKSTAFISLLTVVMLQLVFVSQNRASGSRDDGCTTTTPTWHSPASPDSCNLRTYVFYTDSIPSSGDTWIQTTGLFQMGNYFSIDNNTSGVIKSVDMCFTSNSQTTAQSCIVYFYKADQATIFGQSPAFINTGATWPAYTWVNVPCPDIPYTGPFYAMVDYTFTEMPYKNYFCVEGADYECISFINMGGVWFCSTDYWSYNWETYLQYVEVCENDAVGIKELYPGSISLYPNPANDVVNIVSTNDIRTIEVLNYIGQTVYKTNDINLKTTKLDVAAFNVGEYVVKITTINGIKTAKITVIH